MHRTLLLTALAAAACNGGTGERQPVALVTTVGDSDLRCRGERFADTVPLAEASGAVYVDGDEPYVLVVGDSGTRGAAVRLDPVTGEVLEKLKLPLDGAASDDVEGLAHRGGTFYGITSSGWMRHWVRRDGRFELLRDSYPIGAAADGHTCANPKQSNCARNYEGLCVAPATDARGCDGYAVAKADGDLHCLRFADDGALLRVDEPRPLQVSVPKVLSGCAYTDDGAILVGANALGGGAVYRVGEGDKVELWGRGIGRGFPEAIAAGPRGVVYRFSDTGTAPSLANRYTCD